MVPDTGDRAPLILGSQQVAIRLLAHLNDTNKTIIDTVSYCALVKYPAYHADPVGLVPAKIVLHRRHRRAFWPSTVESAADTAFEMY
jgi:hypothetical protein